MTRLTPTGRSQWIAPITMRLFVYWDSTDGMEYLSSLSGRDFVLAGRFNRGIPFFDRLREWPVEVILIGRVRGRSASMP